MRANRTGIQNTQQAKEMQIKTFVSNKSSSLTVLGFCGRQLFHQRALECHTVQWVQDITHGLLATYLKW